MGGVRSAAIGAVAALGVYESTLALARFRRRRLVYRAAQERARRLNRPVVVVGDPDAGMHTRMARAYPCGDVCVDLSGCPQCPISIPANIEQTIPLIEDDSVVVFVSCVFEYVDDVEAAIAELMRIAGAPANLFSVVVDPLCLTSLMYPGAKWRAMPGGTWRPVTWTQKLTVALALGATAVLAARR